MRHALIATLLVAVAVGTVWGQNNVQKKTNVEYAVHDGVSLLGDLYLPASGSAHPAIVLIHGGGFLRGSKSALGITWGPYLAARGYVVFALDYRLAKPEQPAWPQELLDCKAGLQYLRGNAKALGVDPDRIGVGGESAGASLAALVAVTQDMPRFGISYPKDTYATASTKVKVALPMYGVYDMMAQQRHSSAQGNNGEEQFLGGGPNQVPGAFFESSALNYIREAAAGLHSLATPNPGAQIPWFVAWGIEDHVVPPEGQSVAFVKALRDAGANVTAVPVPKSDHYWFSFTSITGKKGEPECEEPKPGKFSCSGATPNDFIVSQLLDFLSKNL